MDFIDGFPRSKKRNKSNLVIAFSLTKIAYFLLVPLLRNSKMLANLYMNKIVKLDEVLVTVILDVALTSLPPFRRVFMRAWI